MKGAVVSAEAIDSKERFVLSLNSVVGFVVPDRKFASSRAWLAVVGVVVWAAGAQGAVSFNTGSLGAAGNGTDAATVTSGPGAVSAGGDLSAVYDGVAGSNTVVPYNPALNPASDSPFTIEFWARPTALDGDDSPVSNRVSAGNRSGWAFFQRAADVGWNLRMYNGSGSALGWDLTGGTAPLNSWSHVVATWNGTAAQLYVNGVLADSTNEALNGVYNASTGANFIIAATDSGSPYAGSVDEAAFYGTALSAAQILNHFNTATAGAAGAYHSLVRADGALLQLSNNAIPEPSAMVMIGAGGMLLVRRRVSRRSGR